MGSISKKKKSSSLKNRRIQENMSNNELLNDSKLSQGVNISTEQVNKTDETLTRNTFIKSMPNKIINTNEEFPTNINSPNVKSKDKRLNLKENIEHTTDSNKHMIKNKTNNSKISIRKIEDLCMTPKKKIILQDPQNTENIKVENTDNPQVFNSSTSNTNSVNWISNNIKTSPGSPTTCKRKSEYCNNTPNKQKKIKPDIDISDCDQLSDVLKSELYDSNLNDVDPIDMLHDLDSVMTFEESKLSTSFFCSTFNNATQNDEQYIEMSKDPEVDPLFIGDSDEVITTLVNEKNQEIKQTNAKLQPKTEQKSNNENYDIKDILGELDIDVLFEEEEEEKEEKNDNDDDDYEILIDDDGNDDDKDDNDDDDDDDEEENQEILPKNKMEAVYNLKIKLMHNVPMQHKVESTAGTKPLTKIERKQFLKHGPLKSGSFSPNEDEIIINNWKAFCKVHNWDVKCVQPFIKIKYGNKFYIRSMQERQRFIQFLANGLPWRSLFSVCHRFRYLYGNHEKSFQRYTSSEDAKILSYLKGNKTRKELDKVFIKLGKMLGRSPFSVWNRYQLIKKMHENETTSSKVKWTLPLINKFIKTVMSITLCEDIKELKDAIIPKPVWKKLEQKLKIDNNVLRSFWINQLHMQLFCPEPIYLNDIKIKLIEYIYGKGISNTREIVWSNVAKYFDGITSIFLCRTFLYLVQEGVTQTGTTYFPDIAEYLYHEKIQFIKNDLNDKFLPRLSYNNGKVKIVHEIPQDDEIIE